MYIMQYIARVILSILASFILSCVMVILVKSWVPTTVVYVVVALTSFYTSSAVLKCTEAKKE